MKKTNERNQQKKTQKKKKSKVLGHYFCIGFSPMIQQ
jgi:hypothetical protein